MNIQAIDQVVTDDYALYLGDSCDLIRGVPDESVHFIAYSPPFVGLYKFSNSERDLSNSEEGDFWTHYDFLIRELLRVLKPGRLCSVHVMQLPRTKNRNGAIGMYDFRGDVIRAHEKAGWIFHSEVCIWKDPVIAQQRTKSIRLLHKQVLKDAAMSGQGLADYIVTFRKPGENLEPVSGGFTDWIGAKPDGGWSQSNTGHGVDISREAYARHCVEVHAEGRKPWPFDQWVSILCWQRIASPVWIDIDQTRTLQNKKFNPAAKDEREENDEQHISPLQLDVIERCIDLWSNPGDVVLTPFAGIGSEVWGAVNMSRRGIGFELKPTYWAQAVRNLSALKRRAKDSDLFSMEAAE